MGELAKLIGYGVIGLFSFGAYTAWQENQARPAVEVSKANCSVETVRTVADTYLIKDNPDFGYTVRTVVKNTGERGIVRIRTKLTTSEGAFERKQELDFDAGQELSLSFQFHEPTLNASNIQSIVFCSPSSNRGDA